MFFRCRQFFRVLKCVLPQSKHKRIKIFCPNERMSLCTFKKGSLTVEAALIFPFFLLILLAFFSCFSFYASAAELKVQAAADAKKIGIVTGSLQTSNSSEITIYKTMQSEDLWDVPFSMNQIIVEHAVCRAWIGFTELETEEVSVYATPGGEVYHLSSSCTHLDLSVESTDYAKAQISKNRYGERYRKCKLCENKYGETVYITSEGNCYHSDRNCSGLKRTVKQVTLSSVQKRGCCSRCMEKEI